MEGKATWKYLSKKLKDNVNKTVLELCIENKIEVYNRFSILHNDGKIYYDNAKINNDIIEYLETETKNIPPNNSVAINTIIR